MVKIFSTSRVNEMTGSPRSMISKSFLMLQRKGHSMHASRSAHLHWISAKFHFDLVESAQNPKWVQIWNRPFRYKSSWPIPSWKIQVGKRLAGKSQASACYRPRRPWNRRENRLKSKLKRYLRFFFFPPFAAVFLLSSKESLMASWIFLIHN